MLTRHPTEISEIDTYKVLISSYLNKRSNRTHLWKKRWIVLRNCQLSYYKDKSEHKAIKVYPNSEILSVSEVKGNHKFHFAIYTSKKVIHFRAENELEMQRWILEIKKILDERITTADCQAAKEPKEALGDGRRGADTDARFETPSHLSRHNSTIEYSGNEDIYLSSGVSDSSLHNFNPPPVISEENENDAAKDATPGEEYIHEGSLLRLRKRYNQWKRIYVVLTNKNMNIFKRQNDVHPYKRLLVKDIVDVIEIDPLSSSKKWCILIITPSKRIRFCCTSEDEMTQWLASFKTLVERNRRENSK